jgi:hypothetical protein
MIDSLDTAASAVMERLHYRAARAITASRDESKPQIVRDVCAAYLDVHRNLQAYLTAAFRNENIREWIERDDATSHIAKFDMASFMVNIPATWEFEFAKIVGSVNDAHWCAHQYKWVSFVAVRPLHPLAPFNNIRIPVLHKTNSRFRQGFEGRHSLKTALGSKYRSLVQFARSNTKTYFLEQFNKPAPDRSKQYKQEFPGGMSSWVDIPPYKSKLCRHMTAEELMHKTGYTPEEFWREVKKPGTVTPRTELGFELTKHIITPTIYDTI